MEREIQWSDVIEKNPDVIFSFMVWCQVDIDSIKKREGWNQITAIKRPIGFMKSILVSFFNQVQLA